MRRMLLVASILAAASAAIAQPPVVAREADDPAFHATLREAAARYRSWGRLDLVPAFAPELCLMPPPQIVAGRDPRVSTASGPHGRKLYFLYARDRARYPMRGVHAQAPPAIGQVIVKEAFAPREVAAGTAGAALDREGHAYLAGDPLGLYVMALVAEPGDPRTDAGWVYGTLDRDGTITSSGRVASCMGCHASAPGGGRLFGMSARLDRHAPYELGEVVIPEAPAR